MPASFANQAVTNPTISSNTNKLTSPGWSYGASGNTKTDPSGRSFIYDGENRQTSVTNSGGTIGQYLYDGDGKRGWQSLLNCHEPKHVDRGAQDRL